MKQESIIWEESTILVTGGTGSFGKAFIKQIFALHPLLKKLIVFSRDEQKQYELSQIFPASQYPNIDYMIGDVRDEKRLRRAFEGVDYVIHAAALKQVPSAELNQMECIKTNIFGAENVIEAALDGGVKKVIAISTDKAAAPSNLYGATKLCADKLFIAANNLKGKKETHFSVVRYGNVMGSRGSVLPFFQSQKSKGALPVTHPDMTRFNITAEHGVRFVLYALEHSWGGEIFLPKIPSFRLLDLAKAVDEQARIDIVGIRPGEKLHEDMITETDAMHTVIFDDHFVILPALPIWKTDQYLEHFGGKMAPEKFKYDSETNEEWLEVKDLKKLIEECSRI